MVAVLMVAILMAITYTRLRNNKPFQQSWLAAARMLVFKANESFEVVT